MRVVITERYLTSIDRINLIFDLEFMTKIDIAISNQRARGLSVAAYLRRAAYIIQMKDKSGSTA